MSVWNFTIYKSSRQAFLFPESWRKGVKMTETNRQSEEKEERIIEIEFAFRIMTNCLVY
jgi:hypothetical protein